MNELLITRIVAQVDIATTGPAVVAVKGLGIGHHAVGDCAPPGDRGGRLCGS